MILDFNQDGTVSIEDLQRAAHELFEFLKNYDYISRATEIKSTLYNEAMKYMQRDLQNEEMARESHLEDNDQKDEVSD